MWLFIIQVQNIQARFLHAFHQTLKLPLTIETCIQLDMKYVFNLETNHRVYVLVCYCECYCVLQLTALLSLLGLTRLSCFSFQRKVRDFLLNLLVHLRSGLY